MRALPLIERVLLAIVALVAMAVLVFVVAWHVRWAGMMAYYAADRARPGAPELPPPVSAAESATQSAAVAAWSGMIGREGSRSRSFLFPATEPDRLRDVLAGPPPGIGAGAAALARMIACGVRLDGAPIPDGRTPEADYQQWSRNVTERPAFDDAMEALVRDWLRRAARPVEAGAAIAAIDAAIAAMDQPARPSTIRRWLAMQATRDAAHILAAITGATGSPADPWRNCPVPGAAFTMQLQYRESVRRVVHAGQNKREFSSFPPEIGMRCLWTYGFTASAAIIGRWWNIPDEAREVDTTRWEDDVIARRMDSAHDSWSPWKPDKELIPTIAALGLRADARHRLAVLAVKALDARGVDGDFPVGFGIGAGDLAGGGDMPPLVIHGDGRHVCITIDRHAPLAPYLAASFSRVLSTTGEDGALPFSLTPEAVSIDLDDAGVRALTTSATAAATATGAAP